METTQELTAPAVEVMDPGEALEVAPKYDPLAPVGNAGTLKSLLEKNQKSIASLLPKHVTPARIIKTMLVAVNRNPALLRCTTASIFETIQRAAELGLDLSGTLGEAYPVPFKNKLKLPDGKEVWLEQCQLIPGYRGLAKLARQSGEIGRIEAEVVCEHDHFRYEKGTDPVVEFRPLITGDRGRPLGAYALIEVKGCGYQADWMTAADVEKVRLKANSKDSPAWRHHWNEMARKTVFRRAAKWLPLSAEKSGALIQALEQDDLDFDFSEVSEAAAVEAEPGARTAALANRLSGGAAKGETTAEEPAAEAAPAEDSEAEGGNLTPGQVTRFRGLCDKHGIPVAEIEQVFGDRLEDLPASDAAQVEAEILTRAKAKKGGKR